MAGIDMSGNPSKRDRDSRHLPNFLYIGPDKSGSSWLFEVLRQHPDAFVPECKDVYFFDEYYHHGLDWYRSFFTPAAGNPLVMGELSHSYLYSAVAAERISRDLPNVKLMTTLRHPVERCFSHYLYLRSSGLVSGSFEEVLETRPGVIRSSLYAKPIDEYLERFGETGLKVLLFQDLERDPVEFARSVFSFLGLELVDSVDYASRVRGARQARNHGMASLAKKAAVAMRRLGGANLVGRIKRGPITKLLYSDYSDSSRPVMNPDTRTRLAERFAPDVDRLEKLLNVRLPEWRR